MAEPKRLRDVDGRKATQPSYDELRKAHELRREYQRNYRARNPDKVRTWNRDYWLKKARNANNVPGEEQQESR